MHTHTTVTLFGKSGRFDADHSAPGILRRLARGERRPVFAGSYRIGHYRAPTVKKSALAGLSASPMSHSPSRIIIQINHRHVAPFGPHAGGVRRSMRAK